MAVAIVIVVGLALLGLVAWLLLRGGMGTGDTFAGVPLPKGGAVPDAGGILSRLPNAGAGVPVGGDTKSGAGWIDFSIG